MSKSIVKLKIPHFTNKKHTFGLKIKNKIKIKPAFLAGNKVISLFD